MLRSFLRLNWTQIMLAAAVVTALVMASAVGTARRWGRDDHEAEVKAQFAKWRAEAAAKAAGARPVAAGKGAR